MDDLVISEADRNREGYVCVVYNPKQGERDGDRCCVVPKGEGEFCMGTHDAKYWRHEPEPDGEV